jgi:hypothetical protein
MSLFRRDPDSHLEHELRQARPKPREELSRGIASRIERQIPARMGLRLRVGVALASTVVLAVFAASVGGVGYAASSASHAVKAVTNVVTHANAPKPARDDSKGPSHANGSGPSHDNGNSGQKGHDNNDNRGPRGDGDKGKGDGDGHGNPGDHEYHKVHMCHGHHPGDDIEVALPAVPAHLAHGDTLGRCRDRK